MPAKRAAAAICFVNHRLKKWGAPLLGFAIGQPAVQLVNLLTGFLLLRWLSVEHYAQFGVAFAFQSTVGMLADLGFSSCILALAGERARDPEVLGRYIRSARHFRLWLAIGVGGVFALSFPLIAANQPWDAVTKIAILTSILVAVAVQAWAMYQAPLLAHRRLAEVYQPQVVGGALRLGFASLLHLLHVLSGVAAAWLGTLSLAIVGWWTRCKAKPFIHEPARSDPQANREMLRYLAPLMPGVVFTAFQSQIQIALITIYGSSQSIAEVAALGRLAQLFGILNAFNGAVVGPYIASLPVVRLPHRYILILAAAVLLSTLISISAFILPGPLLWLLGPRYSELGQEVGWVVLGSCLAYVGGVMWSMQAARKWIFWWGTGLYIGAVLAAQVAAVILLDIASTRGVVLLGVVTAGAMLAVRSIIAVFGFLAYSPKQ
jgi:O-antigen/teichoic acid export membrane protein